MASSVGPGESGKLKFPAEHAEWTRNMAAQGFARMEAENAAKADVERKKVDASDAASDSRNEVKVGDEREVVRKGEKKSVFGFLRKGRGKIDEVVR